MGRGCLLLHSANKMNVVEGDQKTITIIVSAYRAGRAVSQDNLMLLQPKADIGETVQLYLCVGNLDTWSDLGNFFSCFCPFLKKKCVDQKISDIVSSQRLSQVTMKKVICNSTRATSNIFIRKQKKEQKIKSSVYRVVDVIKPFAQPKLPSRNGASKFRIYLCVYKSPKE